MTFLKCGEAFSPTAVCFGREQNHERYEALKRTISTQLGLGRYKWWPKKGSCNPWNPTSLKETHENVFIRNDIPSLCRGIFPHCCVLWERTKSWGVWGPKADNIYIVGAESLQFELAVLQFSHGSWEYVLWWYFFLVHHLLAEIGRLLEQLKYGIFPSNPFCVNMGFIGEACSMKYERNNISCEPWK